MQPRNLLLCTAALLGVAAGAAPAAAQDVQTGIAAWQAGNYEGAVAAWRPLAEAGNADAQFNLAQAYRLGRGVPQNVGLAEQWFERAARQRHEQAGASLGLLLFQNGRAREAMPWIQAAALRGDPRAQYVFGTALFNGDVVRRDLPRAYALMSQAAAQGFPQAQAQLEQMEAQLSPADRDAGRAMAAQMGAGSAPAFAAIDPPRVPQPQPRITAPAVAAPAPAVTPQPAPPEARPGAGISYAPPPEDGPPPVQPVTRTPPASVVRADPPPRPRPDRPAPAPVSAPAPAATSGAWRVQLGAFSSEANAKRQWAEVRRRVRALGPLQAFYPRAGALTRLRAGPLASRADAERICSAVRASGSACFPIR